MKTFESFENFINESSNIPLTPRQKIAEMGRKQGDLKNKISDLQTKMKEKPEQREIIDLQIRLTELKIQEIDIQTKIMLYKIYNE